MQKPDPEASQEEEMCHVSRVHILTGNKGRGSSHFTAIKNEPGEEKKDEYKRTEREANGERPVYSTCANNAQ